MPTLAIMIARIADELARDDLNPQIERAVRDAIAAYQNDRFLFSETRSLTFETAAGQEFHDAALVPALAAIRSIDQVTLARGEMVRTLCRRAPEDLEGRLPALGQPSGYALIAGQMRLDPVPDDVYRVRLIGRFRVPAPMSGDETGNAWMTEAERLIRARAKVEILAHVILDYERAQIMQAAVDGAYAELKGAYNLLAGSGSIVPTGF